MVIHLTINRNLDAISASCGAIVLLLAAGKPIFALLGFGKGALAVDIARVDPLTIPLGAHLVEGVRLARAGGIEPTRTGVDADDVGGAVLTGLEGRGRRTKALGTCCAHSVGGEAATCTNTSTGCTSAGEVVRRAAVGRVDGRAGVVATLSEGPANREDDAEGHCGREDGGHRGDCGLDGVLVIGGFDNEPEEHVDGVDDPNGTVEVEAVAEHELPRGERLDLKRLDRAVESEAKGEGVEEGGRSPVDADPVCLGTSDTALALKERHNLVESAAGGHHSDLVRRHWVSQSSQMIVRQR